MKRIFFCLVVLLVMSCSKGIEPSLPTYPVNLIIDLDLEWRLKAVQAHKIFNKSNTVYQYDAQTGMGGILIYHGFDNNGGGAKDAYYAFDAACPYEASTNAIVEVDEDGIYAVCPKCGSKYELLNGLGNPTQGSLSTKYLQHYPVNLANNKIIVRNY